MDKLGGTYIVHLLHHADIGVTSKAFHTSPTGHTSEHPRCVGEESFCSGYTFWRRRRKAPVVNVYGAGSVKCEWVNSDGYRNHGVFVAVPFTSTSQKLSRCIGASNSDKCESCKLYKLPYARVMKISQWVSHQPNGIQQLKLLGRSSTHRACTVHLHHFMKIIYPTPLFCFAVAP